MKKRTINVLAVIALLTGVLASGCLKDNTKDTPVPSPSGKFTGQFRVLKKKAINGGYDTTKATISLTIKPDSGYTVVGDAAGVHAPSNGTFANNYYYIQFNDKTFTAGSTKRHLAGVYLLFYDGTRLQMARSSELDTLRLQYDLVRAN